MMDSELSIIDPATDLSLLSIAELRAAVGVTDSNHDTDLRRLGARISSRIAALCNVRAAGATPATLRLETVQQIFRYLCATSVILARRPVVELTSITLDGSEQDLGSASDLIIDYSAALIRRECGLHFRCRRAVIVYSAGWAVVPDDLKWAAEQMARDYWTRATREPGLRGISIPDVVDRQYWVGNPSDPDVSQEVMDTLSRFRNWV